MQKMEILNSNLLDYWRNTQAENEDGLRAEHNTPAKLRDYVILRLLEDEGDELPTALRAFFQPIKSKTELIKELKKITGPDRFRPIYNFLKGKTAKATPTTLNLVAWLIEYKETLINSTTETPIIAPDPPIWKKCLQFLQKKKLPIGIGLGAIGLSSLLYNPSSLSAIMEDERPQGCMIWDGLQFVLIACDEGVDQAGVTKYDPKTLQNFKKIVPITQIETQDLGKVWYYKYNADSLEYFTAPGLHPLNKEKTLRPLTSYMYVKYILPHKENRQ